MGTKPHPFFLPPHLRSFAVKDDPDDDFEEGDMIPVGSCDECGVNIYAHDEGNLCSQCEYWKKASRS